LGLIGNDPKIHTGRNSMYIMTFLLAVDT